jgi:hypothetical protein
MQSHDEGTHLGFAEVLQLIDANGDCLTAISGGFSYGKEQFWEIRLQIPAIGSSPLRLYPNFKLNVVDLRFRLEAAYEASQHAHALLYFFANTCLTVEGKQHLPQVRSKKRWKRFILMVLNKDR